MSRSLSHGKVTVIVLKKVGSTKLSRAFAGHVWDKRDYVAWEDKHVTYVRHPAARLWSAWNYFISKKPYAEYDPIPYYGPHVPWNEWLDWVLDQDLTTIDHHLRPQHLELYDRLKKCKKNASVWIGTLERSRESLPYLKDYVERDIAFLRPDRPPPPHWLTGMSQQQLTRIRKVYAYDLLIWRSVYDRIYQMVDVRKFVDQLKISI